MADQDETVELLAFNFASLTFAYLRLAQGLSRSLSFFSSFMQKYLDRVIKAEKCALFVGNIMITTLNAEYLETNLCEVFQCVGEARLHLTKKSASSVPRKSIFWTDFTRRDCPKPIRSGNTCRNGPFGTRETASRCTSGLYCVI